MACGHGAMTGQRMMWAIAGPWPGESAGRWPVGTRLVTAAWLLLPAVAMAQNTYPPPGTAVYPTPGAPVPGVPAYVAAGSYPAGAAPAPYAGQPYGGSPYPSQGYPAASYPATGQPAAPLPGPTRAPPYQLYTGSRTAPSQPSLTGPYARPVGDPLTPVPATVGRPQPRSAAPVRAGALVPGEGIRNPIWTRGLGLHVAFWMAASLPRVNRFTNTSQGALAGGTVGIDKATDGVVFAPSVALGWSLHRLGLNLPFRIEAEYTARNKIQVNAAPFVTNGGAMANVISVIENQSMMMNLYWDIHRPGKDFQPYVGFGIGSSWNVTQANVVTAAYNENASRTSTAMTYSLMAGFGYRFDDAWMIDTRYRYINMGEVQWGPTTANPAFEVDAQSLTSHELGVGLRYHF